MLQGVTLMHMTSPVKACLTQAVTCLPWALTLTGSRRMQWSLLCAVLLAVLLLPALQLAWLQQQQQAPQQQQQQAPQQQQPQQP